MYAIMCSGAMLTLCDSPRYVRKNENGVYVEAKEPEAEGLAVNGTLYNIGGRMIIPDAPAAVVVEAESGELIFRNAVSIQTVEETSDIAFVLLAEAGSIDDTTAGEHISIFADWEQQITYKAGSLRRYGGKLYRCIQAHTSQAGWEPDLTPSLWALAHDPAEEWPAWSQPIGSADAYPLAAKVSHLGTRWISEMDYNVWEPGMYGWKEEGL